jgi:hypothetical protein
VRCVRLMRNSGEAGEAGNWMQQTEVWVPVIVAIAELIAVPRPRPGTPSVRHDCHPLGAENQQSRRGIIHAAGEGLARSP